MKDGKNPAKKISKKKWFELYDLPDTKILAPITINKR
jgi:hypothetical protein